MYGILEKFMSSKPRVLLGFLPNPKILKSKLGKTLNDTRKVGNPPFEDGFIVQWQVLKLGFRINPN